MSNYDPRKDPGPVRPEDQVEAPKKVQTSPKSDTIKTDPVEEPGESK